MFVKDLKGVSSGWTGWGNRHQRKAPEWKLHLQMLASIWLWSKSLSKLPSATSAKNNPPTRPVISSLIQLCGAVRMACRYTDVHSHMSRVHRCTVALWTHLTVRQVLQTQLVPLSCCRDRGSFFANAKWRDSHMPLSGATNVLCGKLLGKTWMILAENTEGMPGMKKGALKCFSLTHYG